MKTPSPDVPTTRNDLWCNGSTTRYLGVSRKILDASHRFYGIGVIPDGRESASKQSCRSRQRALEFCAKPFSVWLVAKLDHLQKARLEKPTYGYRNDQSRDR